MHLCRWCNRFGVASSSARVHFKLSFAALRTSGLDRNDPRGGNSGGLALPLVNRRDELCVIQRQFSPSIRATVIYAKHRLARELGMVS